MSLAVRVIACLDVAAGRVVKGVGFTDLRDAGDPVERARCYDEAGADEIVFLDITASADSRQTTYDVVRRTAEEVFVPLTVGGGVRSVADVDLLLRAGADKVSISTAAVARPQLVGEVADRFGSQVLVISVDARRSAGAASGFEVTTHGGRRAAGLDAVAWVRRVCALGAGEVLLNSMDADGTTNGFDLDLIAAVRGAASVPLVASGGAGDASHFPPAVDAGADAVLAAGVFHRGEVSVGDAKAALRAAGHCVRQGPGISTGALDPAIASRLRRDPAGLVAAVVQQHDTGTVLMVGWMDDRALHRTLSTGLVTLFSRTRQTYWVKGQTSGNVQHVREVRLDCDGDTVLVRVEAAGPACHTGATSCFDNAPALSLEAR